MLTIYIRENKEEERNYEILTVSHIRQTRLAPDLADVIVKSRMIDHCNINKGTTLLYSSQKF